VLKKDTVKKGVFALNTVLFVGVLINTPMKKILLLLIICLPGLSFPCALLAQGRPDPEFFDFDAPEAWALKYFTSASLITGYGPLISREAGWIDLQLEVVEIPFLDQEYRRIGFNGTKVENLNNAPISIRPHLTYYLREKLALSLTYVPPIELWDVKANLLAGSINWSPINKGPWTVGLRIYGQIGTADGAFTCSEENVAGGDNFEKNPYGCNKVSRDRAHLDYLGAEISAAYRIDKLKGLRPFVAVGYNRMNLKFGINSTLFGEEDSRTQKSQGETVTFSGGFTIPLTSNLQFGLQLFYAPLDVRRSFRETAENDSLVNLRTQITYHFGKRKK